MSEIKRVVSVGAHSLDAELLGGWLVGGSVIFGIVIARYAGLYRQGLGNAEVEGEVALDAHIR